MSTEILQHDHTTNPHQTVTVNSYDWLQYRDQQEHHKDRNTIVYASPGGSLSTNTSDTPLGPQPFSPSREQLANVLFESPRLDQGSGSNSAIEVLSDTGNKALMNTVTKFSIRCFVPYKRIQQGTSCMNNSEEKKKKNREETSTIWLLTV